jgi:DNA (cytosine-5)-methyltransferase 1
MSQAADRPPYRVPTLAEINALPWNGLNVISTFAGGGGSSLGYRMAGYKIRAACEFVPAAADVYEANAAPGTVVCRDDIRTLTGRELLDVAGLDVGELDVLDGSPPCSAFSTAGKRSKTWGQVRSYSDTAQRVDDLFYEYARLVREIQPRVFVAENVAGLVRGESKGYFKRIHQELSRDGYRVEARLLDAQWLGVPQMRSRLIFVGVRADQAFGPVFPDPFPYRYSIADALPHVAGQAAAGASVGGAWSTVPGWRDASKPSATIGAEPQSGNGRFPPSVIADSLLIKQFGRVDGVKSSTRRVDDGPSPTVTATGMQAVARSEVALSGLIDDALLDPECGVDLRQVSPALRAAYPGKALRKLAIFEVRALCSFPPDFELSGSYSQRWERLGRAVPPLMMRAIAERLRVELCAD